MILKIYDKIIMPIFSTYCLYKYKGIWGIKNLLMIRDKPSKKMLRVYDEYFKRHGSWIGYSSIFDGIPCFPHGPVGVFVSGGARIGKNVVIFQQVTIGSNSLSGSNRIGSPTLGDNVYIGAGAKIIGKVNIGNNCRIGANAVVYEDMPDHSIAVTSATRIIQKSGLDNRYFSFLDGKKVYFSEGKWIDSENHGGF